MTIRRESRDKGEGKCRMKITVKERRKRILTALNQDARKRFTFEYGFCSSKRGEGNEKKKKRNQEREERKSTVTVHHRE